MSYVLVAFDLKKPVADYPRLGDEIERIGETVQIFYCLRVIRTKMVPAKVLNTLGKCVGPQDRIFVANISGWLTHPADVVGIFEKLLSGRKPPSCP